MTAAYDVLARVLAATPTPSPSLPAQGPDPDSVTPGLLGFLVVFVLALATWLLLRNMTGRLRRMRYREERRLDAERRRLESPDSTAGPDDEPTAR